MNSCCNVRYVYMQYIVQTFNKLLGLSVVTFPVKGLKDFSFHKSPRNT